MISRTEMMQATDNPTRSRSARAGFTLLELIIAITMLAVFIVPMLKTLGESWNRAKSYTRQRQIKSYAQNKLHDHINFVEDANRNLVGYDGTFEEEGEEDWEWVIDPPQLKSQGEQLLLEYRITVTVPSKDEDSTESEAPVSYTVWTFPSGRWYEDQEERFDDGEATLLYGDPAYDDGALPPGGGR